MFGHVQKQSVSFFDKTEVGRLMSRVQGDVGQLQEFSALVVMTLGELLSLVGIVVALLVMNLKLGLITMSVIPILMLIMFVWQPHARNAFLEVRRRIAIVNGALNENITGVRVVQSMNQQARNLQIFSGKNHDNYKAVVKASKLSSSLIPAIDILSAIAIALVIVFGSRMVVSESLQIGALLAMILYVQRAFQPLRSITMQYTQLQRSMASGSRIFELLDTKPDVVDSPLASDLPKLRGEIELQNVTFGYESEVDIIKDVSLHIEPGQTAPSSGRPARAKRH
jgi:ATP-binding cassette subfamily B protein